MKIQMVFSTLSALLLLTGCGDRKVEHEETMGEAQPTVSRDESKPARSQRPSQPTVSTASGISKPESEALDTTDSLVAPDSPNAVTAEKLQPLVQDVKSALASANESTDSLSETQVQQAREGLQQLGASTADNPFLDKETRQSVSENAGKIEHQLEQLKNAKTPAEREAILKTNRDLLLQMEKELAK